MAPATAPTAASTPDASTPDLKVPAQQQPLLELLNDEVDRRLDRQWSTIVQLDTKAGLVATLALAVAGALLAGGTSWGGKITAGLLAISIVLALRCLAVQAWSDAPTPDSLLQLERTRSVDAHDALLRSKVLAYDTNRPALTVKAEWLKLCVWALLPAAVSLLITYIVS